MASTLRTKHRKQVRGFVIIWGGITFVMAAVTFIAIYMTYGSPTPPGTNLRNVAIPPGTTQVAQAATNTPTQAAQATAESTEAAQALAAQSSADSNPSPPTSATVIPTAAANDVIASLR